MLRNNSAGANTQQYEKNTMNYRSTNGIQRKKKTLNVVAFDNNLQNRFVTISPNIKNVFSVPTDVTVFLISENVEYL